jgi:hypothetical protein
MYLFIFTLLLVLFQFVNSKSIIEDYDKNLKRADGQVEKYQDSMEILRDRILDINHFNYQDNDPAITYWEKRGEDPLKLESVIKDAIYSMNTYETEEHPLIPFVGTGGNRLTVNTIKLLNHKWIIADFSDGTLWGEVLLEYDLDDERNLRIDHVNSFLYPFERY